MHCVMHKIHHGQSRGNEKHHMHVKNHVNITKSEGKFAKLRLENMGKCTETAKIGGNSKFLVND